MITLKKGLQFSTNLFKNRLPKLPVIPVIKFYKPVGLGWRNYNPNKLVFIPKFSFSTNQQQNPESSKTKPESQKDSIIKQPPLFSQQFPKLTFGESLAVMMSGVSLLLWGFLFIRQQYKQKNQSQQIKENKQHKESKQIQSIKQSKQIKQKQIKKEQPIPQQPVLISKVVKTSSSKLQVEESFVVTLMLIVMCLAIVAEYWRFRNFNHIYEEINIIKRILKEQVHGIQLQLIRERLGQL